MPTPIGKGFRDVPVFKIGMMLEGLEPSLYHVSSSQTHLFT